MDSLDRRINAGLMIVNDEGHLEALRKDREGNVIKREKIGHVGNKQDAYYVKFKHQGAVKSVTANRVAWRIHYGAWPPEGLSVVTVDGDRRNYRADNLMLVPRRRENTALKRARENFGGEADEA